MARYFLHISYLGTAYHGWQRQVNGITVQEVLENSLDKIQIQHTGIMGCGRTDTGVHASEFYAHLDIDSTFNKEDIKFKLNSVLPHDIAVHEIIQASDDGHARFDAQQRTYTYCVHSEKNVFLDKRSYLVHKPLDVEQMNKACTHLIGKQEFTSFAKLHGGTKTDYCDVKSAQWVEEDKSLIFTISANRFLRNMVRATVGTLLEVGLGKLKPEDIKAILKAKDRGRAGSSAPAHGLYLSRIDYPYIDRNGK